MGKPLAHGNRAEPSRSCSKVHVPNRHVLRPLSLLRRRPILVWVNLVAHPETRISGQVVYLGSSPRKYWEGREEGRQGKGCYQARDHCGQPEFSPAGELWEPAWSVRLGVTPPQ